MHLEYIPIFVIYLWFWRELTLGSNSYNKLQLQTLGCYTFPKTTKPLCRRRSTGCQAFFGRRLSQLSSLRRLGLLSFSMVVVQHCTCTPSTSVSLILSSIFLLVASTTLRYQLLDLFLEGTSTLR